MGWFEREASELSLMHYVLEAREPKKGNFPFGPGMCRNMCKKWKLEVQLRNHQIIGDCIKSK